MPNFDQFWGHSVLLIFRYVTIILGRCELRCKDSDGEMYHTVVALETLYFRYIVFLN
jgi:hypothetical protein